MRGAGGGKSGGGGGGGAGGGAGGMASANAQHSPHGMPRNYYDRDQRHTQVKTYTDQGNGFNQRSGSTTLYSKVGKLCNFNETKTSKYNSVHFSVLLFIVYYLSVLLTLQLFTYYLLYYYVCNLLKDKIVFSSTLVFFFSLINSLYSLLSVCL